MDNIWQKIWKRIKETNPWMLLLLLILYKVGKAVLVFVLITWFDIDLFWWLNA